MISLKDGIRSLVRIDFKGRVHKEFRGTKSKERCENEAKVLRILEERGCGYVPKLLESFPEEDYIVTTSCGKTADNIISKKKADLLFKELEECYGVRHDDPEPRNITYDSVLGRFCIIDFELAEILDLEKDDPENDTPVTRLHWAAASQQGRRHLTNQDNLLCFSLNTLGQSKESTLGEAIMPINFASFGVSDGVGGNNGGEFASNLVLKSFKYFISQQFLPPLKMEAYLSLLQKTHENLNTRAKENEHAQRLSATYVGAIFQGESLIWANVGDSRLYRLRNGKLEQLSNDHNFAFRQWKRGDISEYEYRFHPRNNVLFDVMGGGHDRISPESGETTWEKGDRYLLCSDGIMDGLSDRKLVDLLGEDKPCKEICDKILKSALANAGNDDTTLIVIDLS